MHVAVDEHGEREAVDGALHGAGLSGMVNERPEVE